MKKWVPLLLPCFTVLCVVLLAEIFFGLLLARRPAGLVIGTDRYFEAHPVIGHQLVQGGTFADHYAFDDGRAYTVTYTLDPSRRRRVPVDTGEGRDRFLMVFGCSYVFGIGVQDEETLPARLGVYAPQYRPYNYGVPGRAAQHMYYRLLSHDMREEVDQKSGIALYLFLGFQMNRMIGGMPEFNLWVDRLPHFEDVEGVFSFRGAFRDAFPYRAMCYDLLYASNTLRYANVNLPLRYRDAHYEAVSRYFEESRRLLQRQFPGSDLVVVTWGIPERISPLQTVMQRRGIRFIDIRDQVDVRDWKLPCGHPTPQTHDTIARFLVATLELLVQAEETG